MVSPLATRANRLPSARPLKACEISSAPPGMVSGLGGACAKPARAGASGRRRSQLPHSFVLHLVVVVLFMMRRRRAPHTFASAGEPTPPRMLTELRIASAGNLDCDNNHCAAGGGAPGTTQKRTAEHKMGSEHHERQRHLGSTNEHRPPAVAATRRRGCERRGVRDDQVRPRSRAAARHLAGWRRKGARFSSASRWTAPAPTSCRARTN